YVAQTEDGARDWRRVGKSPGLTAIVRNRSACVIGITRVQITATHDTVMGIAKIDREGARARRAHQGSVIRIPSVASVSGGEDPCNIRSTRANPGVPPTLGCDARATRREGEFARQRRRHIVTDILPSHPISRAKIWEYSIHRVRSEEHTSELQSRSDLVCRLL